VEKTLEKVDYPDSSVDSSQGKLIWCASLGCNASMTSTDQWYRPQVEGCEELYCTKKVCQSNGIQRAEDHLIRKAVEEKAKNGVPQSATTSSSSAQKSTEKAKNGVPQSATTSSSSAQKSTKGRKQSNKATKKVIGEKRKHPE
jgi:hypothetical protein